MFLDLLDPDLDPLVRGMDPDPDPDPDPLVRGIRILLSFSKNSKKNLDFYCFVTSF
jgi:hypothetical protein